MSYQKIALPLAEEVIKRTKLPDTLPVAGREAARLYNEVLQLASNLEQSPLALSIALSVIGKIKDEVELSPSEAVSLYMEVYNEL